MRNYAVAVLSAIMIVLCAGCSVTSGDASATPTNASSDLYTEVGMQLEGEKPLEAVLTLPKTSGKPPVVVMVQGSGASDKDETIGGNKPFADIAHGLAQRGVASFRYDKRTYTYGEEYTSSVTVEEEVIDDALAAVKQMKADNSLGNVYVLGHSLGGMMAPYIAEQSPDVTGLVILAGSPRQLYEIIYDQNVELVENAGLTDAQKAGEMEKVDAFIDSVANADPNSTELLAGVPEEYWASLNAVDTPQIAQELDIPMFIAQGSADFQVSVDNDYNAWLELLDGKENVQFKLYNNLNHLFMETNGKRDASEYEEASTVEPQVMEDIATFIKENEAKASS